MRARARPALALLLLGLLVGAPADPASGAAAVVDTGLVLAVDVSGSVDTERYRLQMDGIAAAFEDPSVLNAILGGRRRALAVTLVQWSNTAAVAIPWTVIASDRDALRFAARVRAAPRLSDQFTCMSQMMRFVADKVVPTMPMRAGRTVVDVSGDGSENCNPATPVEAVRDELVGDGAVVNGLPILEGREAEMLEGWYAGHVVGGSGSFLVPARGFSDFPRAMRQKFLVEISSERPRSRAGRGRAAG